MKTAKTIRNFKRIENTNNRYRNFSASLLTDDTCREIEFLRAKVKRFEEELEWIKEAFGECVNIDYGQSGLTEFVKEFYEQEKENDEMSAFILFHS